jgi:DNA topoisomerase-3
MTENTRPVRKRRRSPDSSGNAPAPQRAARGKKARKPKFGNPPVKASPRLHRHDVGGNTPLNIPYGNKEVAQKLGARYGADGWYAPPGVDLSPFRDNGWL